MGSLQDDILTPKDYILLGKDFQVKNYDFLQHFNFSNIFLQVNASGISQSCKYFSSLHL